MTRQSKRPAIAAAAALIIAGMYLARPIQAAELPEIVLEQIEEVQPALAKAYAEYRRKVLAENARLTAVIQKAMEKATKAGNLEDAVALKEALAKAKSGELIEPYLHPSAVEMLTGEAAAEVPTGPAVVKLSTGDPVDALAPNRPAFNNRDYLFSEVPKELVGWSFALRSFKEPAPCTITVVTGGQLYVAVGEPSDGLGLDALGFAPTDLKLKATTGEIAIVGKMVRAGETIVLAPSAKWSSFPIWRPASAK